MTNEEAFIRAYDEVRLRGFFPKTVESYLGRLKLFLKYFNDRPIEEMNEIQIREYLLYLLNSGQSVASSITEKTAKTDIHYSHSAIWRCYESTGKSIARIIRRVICFISFTPASSMPGHTETFRCVTHAATTRATHLFF